MKSQITIDAKTIDCELLEITIASPDLIRIGNKVTASFPIGDSQIMEVTGNVTKIDEDAFWLNEIRFFKDKCNFKLKIS